MGAHVEDRVVVLSFHFPALAREKHREVLEDLARRTGWTIQVAPEPHMGAVVSVAREAIPQGWSLLKEPSYFRDELKVRLRVAAPAGTSPQAFQEAAGEAASCSLAEPATDWNSIAFNRRPHRRRPGPSTLPAASSRYSAFATIREACREAGAEVCRSSLKSDPASGSKWLEVALISPQVARRHEELLRALEKRTGWEIRFASEANQDLIKRRVREIVPGSWGLRKDPSYHRDLAVVRITVSVPPPKRSCPASRSRWSRRPGCVWILGNCLLCWCLPSSNRLW